MVDFFFESKLLMSFTKINNVYITFILTYHRFCSAKLLTNGKIWMFLLFADSGAEI